MWAILLSVIKSAAGHSTLEIVNKLGLGPYCKKSSIGIGLTFGIGCSVGTPIILAYDYRRSIMFCPVPKVMVKNFFKSERN